MPQYFGDFPEDATVYIPFNTFTSDDPAASSTITNLADADIKVHKDGATSPITTDGATVSIDFPSAGVTGNHLITIDTSVDAAYATGSDYLVRIEGTTVDGATVNAWVGVFSIENRTTFPKADMPTNFASMGIEADGHVHADVKEWLGTAVTTSSTTSKPEVDVNSISDDATAANNLELDYDGTGYAKANSTIGTCTTNTDMRGTDSAFLAASAPTNFSSMAIDVSGRVDVSLIEGTDATDQINAAVDVALATTTYGEPGQGTPGATISLKDKIGYLYKAWRNKSEQDATTYYLYADDGSTVDQKATVSDNATTATKGEVTTGP